MKTLLPSVARHLWPPQIYALIQHYPIVGMPWKWIELVQGSWMHSVGFDGIVKLDDEGNLRALGSHIGVVYNDPIEMVIHQSTSTVRIKLTEDDKLKSIARGPHCCAKEAKVRYVSSGENVCEVIEHPGGRTETVLLHGSHPLEHGRYTYKIGTGHKRPLGFSVDGVQDVDFEFNDHGYPVAIKNNGDVLTSYDVIIEDDRVMLVKAGDTTLLDFRAAWAKYPHGPNKWN